MIHSRSWAVAVDKEWAARTHAVADQATKSVSGLPKDAYPQPVHRPSTISESVSLLTHAPQVASAMYGGAGRIRSMSLPPSGEGVTDRRRGNRERSERQWLTLMRPDYPLLADAYEAGCETETDGSEMCAGCRSGTHRRHWPGSSQSATRGVRSGAESGSGGGRGRPPAAPLSL